MKRSFAIECVRTHEKDNEIFYRYEIDGAIIWFGQCKKTGNIYTVGVTLPEKIKNFFEVYIRDDSCSDIYYPLYAEIRVHETLAMDDVDAYIKNLEYVKDLCEAIMSIFSMEKHKSLYDTNNK